MAQNKVANWIKQSTQDSESYQHPVEQHGSTSDDALNGDETEKPLYTVLDSIHGDDNSIAADSVGESGDEFVLAYKTAQIKRDTLRRKLLLQNKKMEIQQQQQQQLAQQQQQQLALQQEQQLAQQLLDNELALEDADAEVQLSKMTMEHSISGSVKSYRSTSSRRSAKVQLALSNCSSLKTTPPPLTKSCDSTSTDNAQCPVKEVDVTPNTPDSTQIQLKRNGPAEVRLPRESDTRNTSTASSNPDMENMFKAMQANFSLPKTEIASFNGESKNYFKFVHNFEATVGSAPVDSRVKLNLLIQHCTGEARDAIDDCVILDGEEGYERAMKILRERYGQPHIIAQSHVKNLTNGPVIRAADGKGLLNLYTAMEKCDLTLSKLGYVTDINNTENILAITRRLPMSLRTKWTVKAHSIIKTNKEPTFTELKEFIKTAAEISNTLYGQELSKSYERSQSSVSSSSTYSKPSKPTTLATHGNMKTSNDIVTREKFDCVMCHGDHKLWRCPAFQRMSIPQRKKYIHDNVLCDNCFLPGHPVKDCRRVSYCSVRTCQVKHNGLIHENRNETVSTIDGQAQSVAGTSSGTNMNVSCHQNKKVCLKVVPVKVYGGPTTDAVTTYALLDEGSNVSLCSTKLANKLGASGERRPFSITTLNKRHVQQSMEIGLRVTSLDETETVDITNAFTVDKIPVTEASIPKSYDIEQWPHLRELPLSELDCNDVSLLIGSDVPEVFWKLDERRGQRNEPYAVKSLLGWTIIGPTYTRNQNSEAFINYVNYEDVLLLQQVERFWNADFSDHVIESNTEMSMDDRRALAIMEDSVAKVDGHYQVGLPWKATPTLSDNRSLAEARLRLLKKRLTKDLALCKKYSDTISDYISKGYAQRVLKTKADENLKWFVPHHAVFNPQKPDKLRVVFDCAAKYNGTSLNDQLLQGPDLTNSLVGVLTRFRQERIALVADIESMFHRVRVKPEDCNALRFLWWDDGDITKEPSEYQMLVHLFGATSSPSVCAFALRRTATDNAANFDKETIDTVLRNFYVDDCLKSVKTELEALNLTNQLRALLDNGGFRLTKWVSNARNVIANVPDTERAKSVVNLDLETLPMERTLGVQWNVDADKFEFRSVDKGKATTRRGILSIVSSLFDPLGFASPVTLSAKLILQKLCKNKVGWDDQIDAESQSQWQQWTNKLPSLADVSIDRCLKSTELSEIKSCEIHHFADASSYGYGCVSYIRFVDGNDRIHCAFLTGKSRLAPVKPITIPRLELTAATLSVKMDRIIKNELELPINRTVFWVDSTAVIRYIENEHTRFKTYVANRVAIIHESTSSNQWRYVDSELNPADYASRGFQATDKAKFDVWLNGPQFLWQSEDTWPQRPVGFSEIPCTLEVKAEEPTVNLITATTGLDDLMKRHSSWYKLQVSIAWILRYKKYCLRKYLNRPPSNYMVGELSTKELRESTFAIVRYVQRSCYEKEVMSLEAQPTANETPKVGSRSSLKKLNPVLRDGIMKVNGRLTRSTFDDNFKYPMILPSNHHVTELIIHSYHVQVGHSGTNHVLSAVRSKFWVVKGCATVKRVLNQCLPCKRRKAPNCQQFMAPLPKERLEPDLPPFTYVGLDYFGPMLVKRGRNSTVKRYGCIFTCLTTRAVHLEVSHSLLTDSFICALQRFIARRGRPTKIYSDNGSNFKRGEKELRTALSDLNQQQISQNLRQREIEWAFSPPRAPHFGGIWERMVQSTKKILKSLVQEQLVSDETLMTLLTEVEKILNDRPLTAVSQDCRDDEPLTPSQLLLMRSNSSFPCGSFERKDMYERRWWKQMQYLANVFWRRWIQEYIPTLQKRSKWNDVRENLKVDDIVLIEDDNMPRGKWPLGKIVETYPGKDGLVRSVKVKTTNGCKIRPIVKLCLLESDIIHNNDHREVVMPPSTHENNVTGDHSDASDQDGDSGSELTSSESDVVASSSRRRSTPVRFADYQL